MKPDTGAANDSAPRRAFQSYQGALVLGICTMGIVFSPAPSAAQQPAQPVETKRLVANSVATSEAFFGNVRASEIFSLSYAARGCIVAVSEDAKRDRVVRAGQVLVKLDDLRPQLAMKTAEARLSELAAAIEERELALKAAIADDRRREQELALVAEEFERSSVLMGRGLINESTMDTIERRSMEATFAAERAKETIANAEAAIRRAEIAYEIGELEKRSAEITLADVLLSAPFDGAIVGFDSNVGDCVQEGALAAQIYVPNQKSVDAYFRISRLSAAEGSGLSIGATVTVTRVNGKECTGTITQIDTEADLESQFVQATVDVEESCAPNLFLNEAVEVRAMQSPVDNAFAVPNSAILGENTVFLVDEDTKRLVAVETEIVMRRENDTVVRIPDADGRLFVTHARGTMVDGLAVDIKAPG